MIKKYNYKKLVWIDLESPTRDEVREMMDEYKLDALVAEDLLTPTIKPRVDVYPNAIYLILHFPTLQNFANGEDTKEIDFVIGKQFLITTHYDTIDPLHTFSKLFEVNSILDKSNLGEHAGFIFFYMIRELYSDIRAELESIKSDLNQIEKKIFGGNEKKMVFELSKISRDLLDFKEATNMHKSTLQSLETNGETFFGKEFVPYLKLISEEYFKTHTYIQECKEYLEELRDTNDSMLSYKQNDTMKTFTVLAFIFLPLSFIASLFGMNAQYLPLVNSPHGFAILTLGMAIFALGSILLFRYKKWL